MNTYHICFSELAWVISDQTFCKARIVFFILRFNPVYFAVYVLYFLQLIGTSVYLGGHPTYSVSGKYCYHLSHLNCCVFIDWNNSGSTCVILGALCHSKIFWRFVETHLLVHLMCSLYFLQDFFKTSPYMVISPITRLKFAIVLERFLVIFFCLWVCFLKGTFPIQLWNAVGEMLCWRHILATDALVLKNSIIILDFSYRVCLLFIPLVILLLQSKLTFIVGKKFVFYLYL